MVEYYSLSNGKIELTVMNLGATITSIKYCGREQLLRYETPEEYIKGTDYIGATVGRYGNRIKNSSFNLEGTAYTLAPNEGKNQLHGGPNAFSSREWAVNANRSRIRMSIESPAGDNGFPGNLRMTVTFTVTNHSVHIYFEGRSDAVTVFAPTVHPYFIANNATIQINADSHLEVDSELIPTGKILPCEGDFDYHEDRPVGSRALDDCFILRDEYACTFESNGTTMEMWTDFPAIQVYTGEYLNPPLSPCSGIAIEPEFYPDSPNHPEFPSTVLKPGEIFGKYVEYKFF